MAKGVWHTVYGIEINLSRLDLGHPDRPELLGEILTPIAERDPHLLECLAHHHGRACESVTEGKSPWMFIRRSRVGNSRRLVAAHLPITHKATAQESEQHKALKERVVRTASRAGLNAGSEVRSADGKMISDAVVTGPSGIRIGWEVQFSPLGPSGVGRRSKTALNHGVFPLWVAKDPKADLIDRAPWVRVNDMPWRDIAQGHEMPVRGGYRRLQYWKCTPHQPRPCPDSKGLHCGNFHTAWTLPDLCLPPLPNPVIDTLVVRSATGEHVPIYLSGRHDNRAGSYMWVPAGDREKWNQITGEKLAATRQQRSEPELEDPLTFEEQELDYTCRFGDERRPIKDDPRPLRDVGQDAGRRTFAASAHLEVLVKATATDQSLTPALRNAAALTHRCPPWEIGLCAGCSTPMRRSGSNAAMFCVSCRRALTTPGDAGDHGSERMCDVRHSSTITESGA